MRQYRDLLREIKNFGEFRGNERTGTGTYQLFGTQSYYTLRDRFPLVTTKFVPFRLIFEELMWFLRGETDVKKLIDKNVNIWNADAYRWYKESMEGYSPALILTEEEFIAEAKETGYDLGPIYGHQWRSWGTSSGETIDQISNLIEGIKNDPQGRRHIVTAWNPADIHKMALPPCHIFFQCNVTNDGYLDLQMYQRSADTFLGVPFNIASYSLLTYMIAHVTGLKPGSFIHTIGDAHIYANHIEQVTAQLKRKEKALPQLKIINPRDSIFDFEFEDFELVGYDPHPPIKGKVSVG